MTKLKVANSKILSRSPDYCESLASDFVREVLHYLDVTPPIKARELEAKIAEGIDHNFKDRLKKIFKVERAFQSIEFPGKFKSRLTDVANRIGKLRGVDILPVDVMTFTGEEIAANQTLTAPVNHVEQTAIIRYWNLCSTNTSLTRAEATPEQWAEYRRTGTTSSEFDNSSTVSLRQGYVCRSPNGLIYSDECDSPMTFTQHSIARLYERSDIDDMLDVVEIMHEATSVAISLALNFSEKLGSKPGEKGTIFVPTSKGVFACVLSIHARDFVPALLAKTFISYDMLYKNQLAEPSQFIAGWREARQAVDATFFGRYMATIDDLNVSISRELAYAAVKSGQSVKNTKQFDLELFDGPIY